MVLAEGFLHLDIGAVLQHAHRQGIVKLDTDRDSHNVGCTARIIVSRSR